MEKERRKRKEEKKGGKERWKRKGEKERGKRGGEERRKMEEKIGENRKKWGEREREREEVFVYVNEVLKPYEMISVKEENNIESVWVEITCKNDKKIKLGYNLIVIVGDFNYPDTKYVEEGTRGGNT